MDAASRVTSLTDIEMVGENKEFFQRIKKTLYYDYEPHHNTVSLPVLEFVAELFTKETSYYSLTRLDIEQATDISDASGVSPCAVILAIIYLKRLKECNPAYLHEVHAEDLFIVTLMVASKFLIDSGEDDDICNAAWASYSDVELSYLNQLELEFLNAMDWNIFVSSEEFWKQLEILELALALQEARKRGWYTYWEMHCLAEAIKISTLLQLVIAISSICITAYIFSIISIGEPVTIARQLSEGWLPFRNTNVNATPITNSSYVPQELHRIRRTRNIQLAHSEDQGHSRQLLASVLRHLDIDINDREEFDVDEDNNNSQIDLASNLDSSHVTNPEASQNPNVPMS